MLGTITLLIALGAQIGLLVYRMMTKDRQTKVKHHMRLAAFALFALLLIVRVYWWGFRWIGLFAILAIWAVFSVIYLLRKPKAEKPYKTLPVVFSSIMGCVLLFLAILPGLIFPQLKQIAPTGPYTVATSSVTMVDTARVESFSPTGENRKLTVQFWYPQNATGSETFPLALFSHGSFGFRGSNLSTFENLASHGYVVGSIDHSYHAFFAAHTDGSTTLINTTFLNDATAITNGAYDAQTTYDKTHEWLDLRIGDMDFVLEQTLNQADGSIPESLRAMINTEKIGLFGHSLGGATAAQLGRQRSDVDAVIVVDGTMIGEGIGFVNGKETLTTEPYPVPLLNLYNDSHYEDAIQASTDYNNLSASTRATKAYDVVIRGSGHLNFTDLPLFSPFLARMLGTGERDSRYCIETMNQITLDFFNHTLKGVATLNLQTEY